jgi:starch synthase
MKILFLASEVAPYSKTGGLGDVAKALPAALAARGHEVWVVTPLYRSVKRDGLSSTGERIRLRFPFGQQGADLFEARPREGLRLLFLDHPGFYDRDGIYTDAQGDFWDNHRRFGFFSIGALSAAEHLGFIPDNVHHNDWQCGPAAVAVKRGYQASALGQARTVFTIHNLAYQGMFRKGVMEDLGLPWDLFTTEGLEFHDAVNFMKAGIAFSDAITTVSERYAQEIQTPDYGCNLDGFLRARRNRLVGIVNGVDTEEWDPATDPMLPARYSADDLANKRLCKQALRREFGLPDREGDRPLFGLVSRLTGQKGISLLHQTLPWAMAADLEVVLLGSGEGRFEGMLRELAHRFPGRIAARIGFDARLSHLIEAGSDFFLMPSVYEPCGLNQMYSLRYGTIPIVRATGGLDDTVRQFTEPRGNGIKFNDYLPDALAWAMNRALELYANPDWLRQVQHHGMTEDFSWNRSAEKYERLYQRITQ